MIMLIFVISDKTTDDNYYRSGDEHVVRPGLNLSNAQPCSYSQNNKADN